MPLCNNTYRMCWKESVPRGIHLKALDGLISEGLTDLQHVPMVDLIVEQHCFVPNET